MLTALRGLKQYADIIGVVGALLLFFNWIWSNSVANERLAAAAAFGQAANQVILITELRQLNL